MIFGDQAFKNAHESRNRVEELLRADHWDDNTIPDFITQWSGRIWLTINHKMQERIESVYSNILNANDPSVSAIKKSLKTKTPRWNNSQINRIAPIIKRFLVRNQVITGADMEYHERMQAELRDIGPVHTIWCHYLVQPKQFPPIDR